MGNKSRSWFNPPVLDESKYKNTKQYVDRISEKGLVRLTIPRCRVYRYCHILDIDGIFFSCADITAMTEILHINYSTLYDWYYEGVLPDPFKIVPADSQKEVPIYLASQVWVIARTLNYLFSSTGSRHFLKEFHFDLIEYMHELSDRCVESANKKLARKYGYVELNPSIRWEDSHI